MFDYGKLLSDTCEQFQHACMGLSSDGCAAERDDLTKSLGVLFESAPFRLIDQAANQAALVISIDFCKAKVHTRSEPCHKLAAIDAVRCA